MTTLDTEVLADLIQRKHACLVQLREMGKKQLELVRGGEMTELLDVLAVKQRMLLGLQQIERGLDPFRSQTPEERSWASTEKREACAARLAECETMLAEIVDAEKHGEGELVRRRDEAAVRLKGAQVAGRAHGAYTGLNRRGTSQLDLVSDK